MRHALPLLLLALVACKGSRVKDAVGTWNSEKGMKVEIAADKTYRHSMGPMTTSGVWTMEGDDITLTPTTLNGKPLSDLKANLAKHMDRIPSARRPLAERFLSDMDKPNVLTLGPDGRTMKTNAAKDKNLDPWSTLTKG